MIKKQHGMLRRIIPITQARKDIFTLTTDVAKKNVHYVLTEHGHPKAVLLSVDTAERVLGYGLSDAGASIAADAPKSGYGGMKPTESLFCVQDAPRGSSGQHSHVNKEMVKSRLSVMLVEEYGYSLEHMIIGYYVQVSDNRYIEADVVVHDGHGSASALFMVTAAQSFDARKDGVIDDLYALHEALKEQGQKSARFLVCYACDFGPRGKERESVVVVDSHLYPSRHAWETAGHKTSNRIPLYNELT